MLTPRQREMWRVNKYLWVALAFSLAWLATRWGGYPSQRRLGLAVAVGAGITSVLLRSWVAFRSPSGSTGQWGWAFTLVDIALLAGVVRLTGGLRSDLWLFYLLLSVTETLSAAVKAELLLLALVGAGYTLAVWPVRDWPDFLLRLLFLAVVSAIARRLHLNAEERRRQLVELREQLALSEEKSRVSRELHDGLGREIVNVILGLEVARRVASKEPGQVPALLEENIGLLRVAMNDTRDLIFQTRPWTVDGEGTALGARLERYARQFADRTGLAVRVERCGAEAALAGARAFGLLRIVQESLNNVAKHARATEVVVSLCREGRTLTATVRDDGLGFSKVQALMKSGLGLQSMRERAEDLSATLDVASRPGGGTTVTVRIPLEPEECARVQPHPPDDRRG